MKPYPLTVFETAFRVGVSDTTKNDHGRRTRQRFPRDRQTAIGSLVDLELLADLEHELVERRGETVHRQHDGSAQASRDLGYAVERHRVGAVDRYHHDIEPADRREMAVVELVVQV